VGVTYQDIRGIVQLVGRNNAAHFLGGIANTSIESGMCCIGDYSETA